MRFGLYDDNLTSPLVSISLEVKKKYLFEARAPLKESNQVVEVDIDAVTLKEISVEEKRLLILNMSQYLAKKETSPLKLMRWLEKRKLPRELIEELFTSAKAKKYLDVKRYIEFVVEQTFRKGKKPWWLFSRELEKECILGSESEQEKKELFLFIKELEYKDVEALTNNQILNQEYQQIKRTITLDPNNNLLFKFKQKLIRRGFSERVIREWMSLNQ